MWVLDVAPQDCLCEGVGFVVVTVSWSIGVCLNCGFGRVGWWLLFGCFVGCGVLDGGYFVNSVDLFKFFKFSKFGGLLISGVLLLCLWVSGWLGCCLFCLCWYLLVWCFCCLWRFKVVLVFVFAWVGCWVCW